MLTPNGKVDRNALPLPEGQRPELEAAYLAPQNEIERAIALVWQEVLQVEKVGIEDNFFDLGGHSLLLVQVHSKLCNLFSKNMSVIDLFKYPTIHSLAKYFSQPEGEQIEVGELQERAKKQRQAIKSISYSTQPSL